MSEPMTVKVEIEVQEIAGAIIRQLTEDGTLAEVVRCKDCTDWESEWGDATDGQHFCPTVDRWTSPDWYCADGERKDDGMDS